MYIENIEMPAHINTIEIPEHFLNDLIYVIENRHTDFCSVRLGGYYLNVLKNYVEQKEGKK